MLPRSGGGITSAGYLGARLSSYPALVASAAAGLALLPETPGADPALVADLVVQVHLAQAAHHRGHHGRVGHRGQSGSDVIDESLIRSGHKGERTVTVAPAQVRPDTAGWVCGGGIGRVRVGCRARWS